MKVRAWVDEQLVVVDGEEAVAPAVFCRMADMASAETVLERFLPKAG